MQDDSKKLKYDQIVAIRDAVVTAHQLSAAMLRRNMEMHDSPTKTIPAEHMLSFQHQVYRARKKLCAKQLKGFTVKSQKCKECILPVQTAMCDNFKGWGNFAENVLGIKSNVCISHATGNVQFFCAIACDL